MIKYLEITPPDEAQFRNSTVIASEIQEGDEVHTGDTLFTVKNGEETYPLPSPLSGKITELIVQVGDRISSRTSLLLLETEVEDATNEPAGEAGTVEPEESEASEETEKPEVLEVPEDPEETEESEAPNAGRADTDLSTLKKKDEELTTGGGLIDIVVPDIGGAEDVEVVELMVSAGDVVKIDDSLLVLETDKATVEIPAPLDGTIAEVLVSIGDKVTEGISIFRLNPLEIAESSPGNDAKPPTTEAGDLPELAEATVSPGSAKSTGETQITETAPSKREPAVVPDGGTADVSLTVPDMGATGDAEVIEILVKVGDLVAVEDPIVTVETDKATVDIPADRAGTISSLHVAIGDQISEGSHLASLVTTTPGPEPDQTPEDKPVSIEPAPQAADEPAVQEKSLQEGSHEEVKDAVAAGPSPVALSGPTDTPATPAYASPSVRKFARELGVDVKNVTGTGRKNRVTRDDVQAFVKGIMKASPAQVPTPASSTGAGSGIPPIPVIDFSKFGEIETIRLSRIKRITATNLHRSWLNLPHVTYNEEVDITELEAFRQSMKEELAKDGIRITPLAFQMKAIVSALRAFPPFNSSLEEGGENLLLKKYYNIGVAVDTPEGLVVPVIKEVDKKGVIQLAQELGEISKRARNKKLMPAEMQGGSFTISSLGGIGGTSFTPIINAPEVAIMGVCQSRIKPVWNGSEFEPKLLLPLSLSYDHRVIDGAEAARFVAHVGNMLNDVRRLLL